MSDRSEDGLATGFALAMERGGADAPGAPVAQPGLFGSVIEDADGPPEARRGPGKPGRPPGSRNKRSEDWARFLLSRFKSPLVVLAEIASADLGRIAQELDVEPATALGIKMRAAESLAPYLHEKRPQAVELPDGAGLTVVIQTGEAQQAGRTIEAHPLEESEQEQ